MCIRDRNNISGTPSPLLPMATPVISPQAPMPMAVPTMSRAPRANSGWRQTGGAAGEMLTGELSSAAVAALPRAGRAAGCVGEQRGHFLVTLPPPAGAPVPAGSVT